MTNEQQPADQGLIDRLNAESKIWPRSDISGLLKEAAAAIAALTQPKGIDWQPSADTVKKVIRALTRLGHSTPESPEVVAIQIDQWLMTLCRELDSFMDSLPRQSEAVGYTSQSALNTLANDYASGVMFGAYSERYERTIPLYTTPPAAQGDEELTAWRELSLACSIPGGVIWPNSWPQDVAIVAHLIWTMQNKLETPQPSQADTTPAAQGDDLYVAAWIKSLADIDPNEGRWITCSGCHETEDGQSVGDYPHSNTLGCTLGGGCHECGGLGAVWDTMDYNDFAQADTTRKLRLPDKRNGLEEWPDDKLMQKFVEGYNTALAEVEQAILLADLPTPAAHGVGDGMVVVPREPTEAMLAATGPVVFKSAGERWHGDGSITEQWVLDVQRDCYRAMIQAASAPGGRDA